jgi:acetolactate synthase-1/2/3 large subunit
MNGAESLVRTLVASGVDTCFANPGTSEMHFVAALDRVPGVRCVLGLFEGVVTGAADGYWRLAQKPAATLLHLGPGLANGVANLHNARKATSGVVNVIGEHATHHLQYDAPLTADIEGIARPVSHWIGRAQTAGDVAGLGAQAVMAARSRNGQIASLILPADTAWNEAPQGEAQSLAVPARARADEAQIRKAAGALKKAGPNGMLILGGIALQREGLLLAARIAAATGCRLSNNGFSARIERGGGLPSVGRIPFVVDLALKYLADVREIALIGAKAPIAFFAYPGKPSVLTPDGCTVTPVAEVEDDLIDALERLADAVGAPKDAPVQRQPERPALPDGAPSLDKIAAAIAALLPDDAVVVDESVTSGRGIFAAAEAAGPHDWLNNMGGSIGYSLPVAVGAALACPERRIVTLTGDGSAFYTLQALWTMAREQLNVTMVIFANRSYAILRNELANVGAANPGPRAIDMLTLDRPDPDWVALAKGHGVPAIRVDEMNAFSRAFAAALETRGPQLIELML